MPDINDIRIVITLVLLVVFIGICAWAWSSRNRKRFEEAAQLPFAEDERRGKTNE